MPTVAFLTNMLTQYSVLNVFIDELKTGFQRLGWRTVELDLQATPMSMTLIRDWIQKNGATFLVAMNGVLTDSPDFYRAVSVPVHSFYVDHPIYHVNRLLTPAPNKYVSFISREHCRYFHEQMDSSAPVFFTPHAATQQEQRLDDSQERPIDVSFFGSYTHPDKIRGQWMGQVQSVRRFIDGLLEYCLYHSHEDLYSNYLAYVNAIQLNPEVIDNLSQFAILRLIDLFTRNFWREKVLRSITDTEVLVYGNGWNECNFNKNIRVHPEIEFRKAIEVMRSSKIVLDINTMYIEGAHERVFQGMQCGAVSLSVSNKYLRKTFTDGHDIILYDPVQVDAPQKIRVLLDSNNLSQIAYTGKVKVQSQHTWLERAKAIQSCILTKM